MFRTVAPALAAFRASAPRQPLVRRVAAARPFSAQTADAPAPVPQSSPHDAGKAPEASAADKKPVTAKQPAAVKKPVSYQKPVGAKKPASATTLSSTKSTDAHRYPEDHPWLDQKVSGNMPPRAAIPSDADSGSPPVWSQRAEALIARDLKSDTVALDIDWNASYHGASSAPVSPEQYQELSKLIPTHDIEVKPDGVIYLPEIKYRRRLNQVFGPMGWALIPRGETAVGENIVTREYALIIQGRFASQAQGENNYFGADQLPSAVEGCKSNALMRCCKDLGVASELWDPVFVRWFRKTYMVSVWVEHMVTKKKKMQWFKKGDVDVQYPYKLTGNTSNPNSS